MVSVLESSAVDRELEPRLGQTKDCRISICCISAKLAAWQVRVKTGWFGFWIMCHSGEACFPKDCCLGIRIMCQSREVWLPKDCCV